jgi:hypothetical protein
LWYRQTSARRRKLFDLYYILGLQQLGYEAHYSERQNKTADCYDPIAEMMINTPRYTLSYLATSANCPW